MKLRALALIFFGALAVAACGGSDDPSAPVLQDTTSPGDSASAEEMVEDATENAEDLAEDLADSLEETQAQVGGGSATLTVGDETWTFSPVLCAIGEDQIGQAGAEFVLSAIQDGKQMYFSIDSFGHSASIDDIKDFENPSVSVRSSGDGFIQLDGKSFGGSAEFVDNTSDSFETVPGSFSGTCP